MKHLYVATILLTVLVIQVVCVQVIHAQEGQVTIAPTDDTYADLNNPDSNYGGQSNLVIENFGSFPADVWKKRVWLKFNLSEVPDGAVVNIATLELYSETVTETYEVQARRGSHNSWTEFTLTWNNGPDYESPLDKTFVASNSQWYSWNVTDAVRENLNGIYGGSDVVTIILLECCASRGMGSQASFLSKEGPVESKPKLTIHWTEVIPEYPSFLLILPLLLTITSFFAFVKRKKGIT